MQIGGDNQCNSNTGINTSTQTSQNHQKWYISLIGNTYYLQPQKCDNQALDKGAGKGKLVTLQQFDTNNNNQKWKLIDVNTGLNPRSDESGGSDSQLIAPPRITLSPNPAQNEIRLDLSDYTDQSLTYFISNINGQIVDSGQFDKNHPDVETLNLQYMPNGHYFIHIRSKSNLATSIKFVIVNTH